MTKTTSHVKLPTQFKLSMFETTLPGEPVEYTTFQPGYPKATDTYSCMAYKANDNRWGYTPQHCFQKMYAIVEIGKYSAKMAP